MSSLSNTEWRIDLAPEKSEQVRAYIQRTSPWQVELHIGEDFKASDFGAHHRRFVKNPLVKVKMLENALPENALEGLDVLDVGYNYGYTGLYLGYKFGCKVTGIDVQPMYQQTASFLAGLLGVDSEYLLEDAHYFCRPERFDLITYFGTLYHLRHPFLALENSVKCLKPGGYIALETIIYTGESNLNKWIHGYNDDVSNYWALHMETLESIMTISGCTLINILSMHHGKFMHTKEEKLARGTILFQKNKS